MTAAMRPATAPPQHVGLVFGGPSPEHEVSCSSALAVLRALPADRFQAVVIGVTRDGGFVLVDEQEAERLRGQRPAARAIDDRLAADGRPVRLQSRTGTSCVDVVAATASGEPLATIDVVFPVLHGTFGEDGVLQGLLETLSVPYVGCGVLASAVCMNKIAMKRAFQAEHVPVTPHVWFEEARWRGPDGGTRLVDGLRWPLFVKPANMGSSLGVSRVDAEEHLPAAVEEALRWDRFVIAEQAVLGRELECGVLGGAEPAASAVGEVTVADGAFDYRQKYFADADPMVVPAPLDAAVAEEIRALSVRAFQAVGGWGLARAHFFLDEKTGDVYVNELNTMPGFTAHSMYPKVWGAAGVPYPELLLRLIDLAFTRHADVRKYPSQERSGRK
jgi:D-alanine-D-alanine ligase